ncbi:hypothetical protein ACFYW9_19255 [Streptomyces sp. NPDC002698]|uniref:hypothetical protein n=1 Tax=Streptomyces sp. NPDC002698 TaxID=3364660 RepID=UPI0036A1722C
MANEVSYPFSADSAGGGSQMMSQAQWQFMARVFGKDRVDFRLEQTAIDAFALPFTAAVTGATTVTVTPGRAVVGGFYYQLTATATVTITANTGSTGRIDLIVLRADMSAGSVNIGVVKGQPAASPKAPGLTRNYGGVWEMPLYQVTVPANSGALSTLGVMPFDAPEHMAVPWNAVASTAYQTNGSFMIDMDSNNTDTQTEYWIGRDGNVISRDLSKPRSYTPALVNTAAPSSYTNRVGRWRWIAPGTVYFSVEIENPWEDTSPNSGSTQMGFTLPTPASGATGQTFTGVLSNPYLGNQLPNFVEVVAKINRDSSSQSAAYMFVPSPVRTSDGLDFLTSIPPVSKLTISGIYEAATFAN